MIVWQSPDQIWFEGIQFQCQIIVLHFFLFKSLEKYINQQNDSKYCVVPPETYHLLLINTSKILTNHLAPWYICATLKSIEKANMSRDFHFHEHQYFDKYINVKTHVDACCRYTTCTHRFYRCHTDGPWFFDQHIAWDE